MFVSNDRFDGLVGGTRNAFTRFPVFGRRRTRELLCTRLAYDSVDAGGNSLFLYPPPPRSQRIMIIGKVMFVLRGRFVPIRGVLSFCGDDESVLFNILS